MFVNAGTWTTLLITGLLVTTVGAAADAQEPAWAPLGLAVCVIVIGQMMLACRRVPWIPGIIATVAAVQWVLAALLAYRLAPTVHTVGTMAVPANQYFAYVVPALVALVAGLWLPLRHEGRRPTPPEAASRQMTPQLRIVCEAMVWLGLALRLARPVIPVSMQFALLLVAQLAYVGAFALTLARTPRWWVRLAAVLVLEFVLAARDAMFLQVLVWGLCAGAIVVYRVRPRLVWIVSVAAGGLLLVAALNVYKRVYRLDLVGADLSGTERAESVSSQLTELLSSPTALLSPDNFAYNIGRLNQGTLTSRVLAWVPAAEPFAQGETIASGLRAALVPRVLDPDKYVAGGREYFERFTGLELMKGTSMNLSIPGEMYANFGYTGGILGVFAYALCIGLLFRWIARWARRSPLWWAWAPFLLLSTLSAEDGFGETVNQVTKALLVMLVVTQWVPAWRALRPQRSRRVRLPSAAPVTAPIAAEVGGAPNAG